MMHLGIRFYQVKDAALVSDVGGDQRVLIRGRHIPAVCHAPLVSCPDAQSLRYYGYVKAQNPRG